MKPIITFVLLILLVSEALAADQDRSARRGIVSQLMNTGIAAAAVVILATSGGDEAGGGYELSNPSALLP